MLRPPCIPRSSSKRICVPPPVPVDTRTDLRSNPATVLEIPHRRSQLPAALTMVTVLVGCLAIAIGLAVDIRRGSRLPELAQKVVPADPLAASGRQRTELDKSQQLPAGPSRETRQPDFTPVAFQELDLFPVDLHRKSPVTDQTNTELAEVVKSDGSEEQIQEPDAVPATPPLQRETLIHATAVVGHPCGVGKLEVVFRDDECPRWYPDTPLFIDDKQGRVHSPAIEIVGRESGTEQTHNVRRICAYFLFRGKEPLTLQIASPGESWIKPHTIQPASDQNSHRELLTEWWKEYERDAKELSGPARVVRQLAQNMLARRLKLDSPPVSVQQMDQRPMAALESKFERSLSTLLGIDSLLLAVPEVTPAQQLDGLQVAADLPMPATINVPPVRIPTIIADVPIERLAYQVPDDCFYVRCESVSNFAWLRQLVTGWGGSLNDIVSLPMLDHTIRSHVEGQLALSLQHAQDAGIDRVVSDFALIGTDFFFRDGAAVGVVFQASDSRGLRAILEKQRDDASRDHPAARHDVVNVDGRAVDSLTNSDHRLRSFYVVRDGFHLVTNSQYILRRFLSLKGGEGSLGRLNEFRYARAQQPVSNSRRVLMYLSDPFFRQLAGPHYRIELGRRALALAELQELALAPMIAVNCGSDTLSVESLTALGYFSPAFGRRADGGKAMLVGGQAIDSLRGRRGTFLPIPDVTISRISQNETNEYAQFRANIGNNGDESIH